MSVPTSVPDGNATGPAPRGSRVVPTVLTVLACVVQTFVLFFTFVMGLGWGGLTYVAALLQAGLAFVLIARLATRGRRTVVLVPLLSAALTAALAVAGTAYARAAACSDRVLAAAQSLAPLPGGTAEFEGHEIEGCLATTRTSLPDQAILEHYETELTRLGWRLTPERTEAPIGTAAEKDGISIGVDINPADEAAVSTLEVVVGDAASPTSCVINIVDGFLKRTPTTAVEPGTWSTLVSTEDDPASVVIRDSTSAVVLDQKAQRRPGTSDDTLRVEDLPEGVDTLTLQQGVYQIECRLDGAEATSVPLRVAWDNAAGAERDKDVVVRIFETPDHWRSPSG